MAKRKKPKSVETLTCGEAGRRNIPTAECHPVMADLSADFNRLPDGTPTTECYRRNANWSNRMIFGDSPRVIASTSDGSLAVPPRIESPEGQDFPREAIHCRRHALGLDH